MKWKHFKESWRSFVSAVQTAISQKINTHSNKTVWKDTEPRIADYACLLDDSCSFSSSIPWRIHYKTVCESFYFHLSNININFWRGFMSQLDFKELQQMKVLFTPTKKVIEFMTGKVFPQPIVFQTRKLFGTVASFVGNWKELEQQKIIH